MKQIWISNEHHEKLREKSFKEKRSMSEIAGEALGNIFCEITTSPLPYIPKSKSEGCGD